MKILVVCQYYYPEPFRITDICEKMVLRGHEISVLTGLPNYPEGKVPKEFHYGKRRNETINGVRIIRSYELGRGKNHIKLFLNYISFSISASIKSFFIKNSYDVILIYQLSPVLMSIPAIIYKKKNKKKILLYCLDLWPESLTVGGVKVDSLIYKIFLHISKSIYKSADTIAVTSNMFIEYFKNTLNLSTDNMIYMPQCAEDVFTKILKEPEKDGINKTYNFLFAGNIGEFQSVETIVYAADLLRDNVNIVFHIVGDGSKLKMIKQLAGGLKLNNLIFYGRKPIEDMPKYYEMADAMLITLVNHKFISYTLPGKIQTYLATGKPIIGALNGEGRWLIENVDCGLCCSAENYEEFSKLILIFVNSDRKEQMKSNAKKFYLENFNESIFMENLENELLKLNQ